MSRRHYKVEQSYVDWLKSLGCVLYLPLIEGDLQDKISGVSLIANQGASITWDSTKGAYKFNVPGSVAVFTGIQLPNVSIDFGQYLDNIEYTCVIDINVNAEAREQFTILSTDRQFWKLSWYGGNYSANKWIRLSCVKESGQLLTKEYEDGRLIEQSQQDVSSRLGTYLFTRPSWCYGFTAFVKSAYIFKKVLTQEQINQLI